MVRFEDFEKDIMERLLVGNEQVLEILREQYANSQITRRDFTGTGFLTTFTIPNNVPRLEPLMSFQLGDVIGKIDGVNDGVGFVLFIKNGVINYLEGYTYGEEKWPEFIPNHQLSFVSGQIRDIDKIKAKWEQLRRQS